ncbi:DsbA family protein [Candidatus Nitrosopelagicus sp.]|nr:DsbA family protein [Candidatus Nitrosopelagicus sp.]
MITNLDKTSDDLMILNKENLLKGSTILGNPNAKITIVEFGDYQCTFCYKFHDETMDKIYEKYVENGEINFVYKDFPLNGAASILASEASYCAQNQDKFWEYHNMLYDNWAGENTGWITNNVLLEFAKESGLNLDQFNSCMNNSIFYQKVIENEQFAKKINIDATPSFLIFNENEVYRIKGAQSFEIFEQTIQELGTN